MTPDTKLEKLKEMLSLLNDGLSKSEFIKAFEGVIRVFKKVEAELTSKIDVALSDAVNRLDAKLSDADDEIYKAQNAVEEARQTLEQIVRETRAANDSTLAALRRRATESVEALFTKMRVNARLDSIMRDLMAEHAQTIAALNTRIQAVPTTEEILAQIPEETAEETRNKLETLQGEDRLDAKAIKNLPEATKQIVSRAGWGAHPLVVKDDGTVVDKVARILNFTGGTVTRSADGTINVPISAGGTDEKVKYNSSDSAAGYLADKIVAGTGISLAEGTGGDADKLVITNTVSGGTGIVRSVNVISTATNAGASAATDYVYLVSGTTTLTLPTAVGNTNRYTVKNDGVAVVTVDTTSAQTIDGTATIQIAAEDAVDIISDNSDWLII